MHQPEEPSGQGLSPGESVRKLWPDQEPSGWSGSTYFFALLLILAPILLSLKNCAMSTVSSLVDLERLPSFLFLIHPYLSCRLIYVHSSVHPLCPGPGSHLLEAAKPPRAPGKGPWTSSDTHISYYAVRAFFIFKPFFGVEDCFWCLCTMYYRVVHFSSLKKELFHEYHVLPCITRYYHLP